MPLSFAQDGTVPRWDVRKIAVIGPGIVGMPMAALLAHAGIALGEATPPRVVVVQRASKTSGWKVDAINEGRSPIGGVEPDLDRIVAESVARGLLSASHDPAALADADVILVCVQTDKRGIEPDYGPLFEALDGVCRALQARPAGNVPLVVFESTLAPSSMATVVRDHFAKHGLVEGRDVLLGNSPNRVMPGRLVERVASADKIVAGLHPATPQLIARLYGRIVTRGTLHPTNSLTAEVVKTLENAYRDVRIAYSAEVARFCDARDVDFYAVRDAVNDRLAQRDAASADPNAVPSGGLLVPTVGVGGHCLPKDGILLWWRKLESGADTSRSLILESRRINDESPAETVALAERIDGPVDGRTVALLGTAYRFNSEDTRNSPTLALARLLKERGCTVRLHDPYVYPHDQNLLRFGLAGDFTRDAAEAVRDAELLVFCTGHRDYLEGREALFAAAGRARAVVDACNLLRRDQVPAALAYTGIGRGTAAPSAELLDAVEEGFRRVEHGLANELADVIDFLNARYAGDGFNRVVFDEVRRLAGTCITGCDIATPAPVTAAPLGAGFEPRLVRVAAGLMPAGEIPAVAAELAGV
jgi:UDP-N-acetyl-D-mannosaminuronic acid dehydrogenase